MTIYAYLLLMSLVFLELFLSLGLPVQLKSMTIRSREAFRIVSSPDMDDDTKEVVMRTESFKLLKSTMLLILKLAAIGVVLHGSFLAFVTAFPDLEPPLLDNLLSPVVIIMLTIATLAYARARNVLRTKL